MEFEGLVVKVPWLRMTLRDDQLTIVPWEPHLACGASDGSSLAACASAGITIADGYMEETEDGDELIVETLALGDEEAARDTLLEWGGHLGYRRIWFAHHVIDLVRRRISVRRIAHVSCPTCTSQWSETGRAFWSMVIEARAFPVSCPACAGALPQWSVTKRASRSSTTADPGVSP